MLSNAYFLAKFRFDTAENETAKHLQNFRKNAFFEKGPRAPPDEFLGERRGSPSGAAPQESVADERADEDAPWAGLQITS